MQHIEFLMTTGDKSGGMAGRGDMSLMKAVARGSQEAFMALLDRYVELVSRTSFRILCDREDSEAVTVKVFTSLWKDVLEYDDRFTLSQWLLRKTYLYSRVRIVRRRLLRIFGVSTDLFVRASPKVEDHDDFIVKKAWELFCRASLQMTSLQSAAYALCALEGMETREVARITGHADFRISIALQHAYDRIRDELKYLDKDDDYERFTGFLRKVAESLTDRRHIMAEVRAKLNISDET